MKSPVPKHHLLEGILKSFGDVQLEAL